MNIEDKEKKEIEFWRDAPEEKPGVLSVPNLINKFKEADIFIEKLVQYSDLFRSSDRILELGGGQGWASSMVKHYHPNKNVILSDISEHAVESAVRWEGIFEVTLDGKQAFRSYETGLEKDSLDLVFCFASAHHFVKHEKTFVELQRILKPGGKVLYLYEPVCRAYIYKLSFWRANRKRPQVPEDVLIYKRLLKLARQRGFKALMIFSPTTKNRSVWGSVYYFFLGRLPYLQSIFPCTADFIFTKEG